MHARRRAASLVVLEISQRPPLSRRQLLAGPCATEKVLIIGFLTVPGPMCSTRCNEGQPWQAAGVHAALRRRFAPSRVAKAESIRLTECAWSSIKRFAVLTPPDCHLDST